MAEVTINNSPVHSDTSLSAVYGETGPNWARFHTGDDFIPYGSTPTNPEIYPVFSGTVVQVSTSTTLWHGNMVLIQDGLNRYWRYCHMQLDSIRVHVGQQVTLNTVIGNMGATGNVTGIHLHLECSTTQAWDYDTFLNPSTVLNIPNQRGTIIHFGGTPPEPPVPTDKSNSKKWFCLLNRKVRYNL